MKIQKVTGWLSAAWAMLTVTGCGFGYYKAISQPTTASAQIQKTTEFKVRPLSYAKIAYGDLGYETEAAMREEFANFSSDFTSHFKGMWEVDGVPEKKITMVGADEEVAQGILVETEVDRIQLNWNAWSNNADDFFITIGFTDAATKAKLFSGQFQVKNTAFAQGFGQNMQARLNNAAYNTVWLIVKIMSNGVADPAKY